MITPPPEGHGIWGYPETTDLIRVESVKAVSKLKPKEDEPVDNYLQRRRKY